MYSSNLPGFLSVLEGALPGWRVSIDGNKGAVERANAVFIGTEVPAGTHRVEFRFLPASAVLGVVVTSLTALLLILYLGRELLSRGALEAPLVPFVSGGSGGGLPEIG